MKPVVALLLCVALPAAFAMFAASVNDDLHKMEEECSKESGVSFEEIEIGREKKDIPDNLKMKKWARCMMIKHNVMDKDGAVIEHAASLKIPADTDEILRAFEKCKTRTGKDVETTAREMMNCYLQQHQMVMALTKRKSE